MLRQVNHQGEQEQTHLLAFYHSELTKQFGMQRFSIIFSTSMNIHHSEVQTQTCTNKIKKKNKINQWTRVLVLLIHAGSVCQVKVTFPLSDRCVCVCVYMCVFVTGDPIWRANLCFLRIMRIRHSEMQPVLPVLTIMTYSCCTQHRDRHEINTHETPYYMQS